MKTNTTFHPGPLLRALFAPLLAIAALFAAPAAARAGLMYVSTGTHIDQVSSTGSVSTFATPSSNPTGLAFDTSGNLYASEPGASKIRKITPGGVVSLFASLPFSSTPQGLAFDSSGNLYAAGAGEIKEISPDGLTVTTFATGIPGASFIAIGPVPEPGTALFGLACVGVAALRRRRRA